MIFAAGLGGSASEFGKFGEPTDPRIRAEMLDEGLDLLRTLWLGEEVKHHGSHYTVDAVTLAPTPVQDRIPIWIGGNRMASLHRASRWDGWVADSAAPTGMTLTPDDLARSIAVIGREDEFQRLNGRNVAESDEAVRMRIWQAAEKNAVHDTENGSRRADAESEG